MEINGYKITTPLRENRKGISKWGFAEKDGDEYFIKEFSSPIYPVKRDGLSEEQIMEEIAVCKKFQEERGKLYRAISECVSGNIVPVYEFFRDKGNYYIAADKIEGKPLTLDEMKNMSPYQKLLVTRILAYSLGLLHSRGIVYGGIEPRNILFSKSQGGVYTAKLIDFDNSFFVDNPPKEESAFTSNLNYLAPECYLYMSGEGGKITTKADVFSLGIFLHLFWNGEMPIFNYDEYEYPFEAVLCGEELDFSRDMPRGVAVVLNQMLRKNPDDRPSLSSVFMALAKINFDK